MANEEIIMPETQTTIFETDIGDVALTYTNQAQLNQMWGSIASQLGDAGIMGDHTSSQGTFTPDPGDGGPVGVGNLSKTDEDFINPDASGPNNLASGGQGLHGIYQAARLGEEGLPPDSVEASIGPLFPNTYGNVTYELLV